MKSIERRITYGGRRDWISFYFLFDIHLGARVCAEDKLQRLVEQIAADESAYWLYGGDGCEFINRKDPRFKESDLAPWLYGEDDLARAQAARLLLLLKPIASQCIGMLTGNHEQMMLLRYERNVMAYLLEGIKDAGGIKTPLGLGYRGFVVLRCQRSRGAVTTLILYAEHGWGGGRLRGANVLLTDRVFSDVECDVYMTGHRHRAHVHPHTMYAVQGGAARTVTKVAGMAGTFRENIIPREELDPGDYADAAGYSPADVAGVKISYQPDNLCLKGEVFSY